MIYFTSELQKKLLPIFHYSLKQGGLLFFGSSETIGQATDLFTLIDSKNKIFKRHPSERSLHLVLDFSSSKPGAQMPEKEVPETIKPSNDINIIKLLQVILSQSDLPICVVIDDSVNIVYIHGHTGRVLEPAQGVW
jgi:two-component system CheB/CheR fusion protein